MDKSKRVTQFGLKDILTLPNSSSAPPANSSFGRNQDLDGTQDEPVSTKPEYKSFKKPKTLSFKGLRMNGSKLWADYREVCYLPGGKISLAVSGSNCRVHVRKLGLKEEALACFAVGQDSAESNIVQVLDMFCISGLHHVILEEMPLSLYDVIQCVALPSGDELAAILAQILDGLVFLAEQNLGHGSLDCHNIYLTLQGYVKLGNHDCFQTLTPDIHSLDATAVHTIALMLMQKDGSPQVKDQRRWESFHKFVEKAAAASTAVELRKAEILSITWRRESLMALFAIAEANKSGNFRMAPKELEKSKK